MLTKTKKIKHYPKVLLIGRTNVGKSTLFNRLADQKRSIVLEQENVTRDYINETIDWNNTKFDLIDTGGLNLNKQPDSIFSGVQKKVLEILPKSKLIFMVCDIKAGVTDQDRQISKLLHKNKVEATLLLNKADNKNAYEENFHEFHSLGFKEIIPISAIHGHGILDILEKIVKTVPDEVVEIELKPSYNVTLIGRPNVGKSSLMNLLVKRKRSIVSEIAGTTRESISEPTYCYNDLITVTDTAGLRRKNKINENLEGLMAKSSLQAIRDTDIVALMIDASDLQLSSQELRLLDYASQQKKSIILIVNKRDLVSLEEKEMLKYQMEEYDFLLKKIPIINISCKTKKNLDKLFAEFEKAWERRNQDFNTTILDEMIKEHLELKPLYHKRIKLKLFKIRHVPAKVPTFVLHVNFPEWFGDSQLRFIENIMRSAYDLKGCPVVFAKKKV